MTHLIDRTRSRLSLLVLAAVLVACSVLLAAPHALAHSTLEGSDPADGSTLRQAPAQVRLTFNEDVKSEFSKVLVTTPDGRRTSAQVSGSGPDVVATLPSGLGGGAYRVVYSVVSADTHRVSGEIHFTVAGGPSTTAAASTTQAPSATSTQPARQGSTSYWAWLGPLVFVVLCVPLAWVALRERARRRRRGDEPR